MAAISGVRQQFVAAILAGGGIHTLTAVRAKAKALLNLMVAMATAH